MDFYRGEAYTKFFEFLDSKGGFYYEVSVSPPSTFHSPPCPILCSASPPPRPKNSIRNPNPKFHTPNENETLTPGFPKQRWGDAPVHSIAVSLFTSKKQLHYFRDIGYKHDNFGHCPPANEWAKGKCSCKPNESFSEFFLCFFLLLGGSRRRESRADTRFVRSWRTFVYVGMGQPRTLTRTPKSIGCKTHSANLLSCSTHAPPPTAIQAHAIYTPAPFLL